MFYVFDSFRNVRTLNEAIGDDVLVSLDIPEAFTSARAIITTHGEEKEDEFETFLNSRGEIREHEYYE